MSLISLRTVPFDDPQAQTLVAEFYADQLTRYERADPPDDDPRDYAPPCGIFLLLSVDDQPAGCGGYKTHDTKTGEIKRLYVRPGYRGHGNGRRLLSALEEHGRAVGATSLLLETGVHNTAAISLFSSAHYVRVPSYVLGRNQHINRAFAKSLSTSPLRSQQAHTVPSVQQSTYLQ